MNARPIPKAKNFRPEEMSDFLPQELRHLAGVQTAIPRIAKDERLLDLIRKAVARIPTRHVLIRGDAREMLDHAVGIAHLVITSPPYWTLKEYRPSPGQLGHVEGRFELFKNFEMTCRVVKSFTNKLREENFVPLGVS